MTGIAALDTALKYLTLRERQLRNKSVRERVKFLKENPSSLTDDDLDKVTDLAEDDRRSLFLEFPEIVPKYEEFRESPDLILGDHLTFMRRAWPYMGIPDPFTANWHHSSISKSLGRLATGECSRLICNQPPGTTKSISFGVMFQAWRWAVDPGEELMYVSFSDEIPRRTGREFLNLINSQWYQRRWGHKFKLVKDAEQSIYNSVGGFRLARGYQGGITGEHPRYMILDDITKGMNANNQGVMRRVVEVFSNTIASRGILKDCRIAVVMQRLAANDLCGVLLGENKGEAGSAAAGWEHICFPMHFDPEHPYIHPDDPRTVKGQLLWPERIDEARAQRMRDEMSAAGDTTADAQMEQNPALSKTMLFGDVSKWRIPISRLPVNIRSARAVRSWDKASTEGGGDWTVGVLIAELEGIYYILDVQRFRVGDIARDAAIVKVAEADRKRFASYRVSVEKSNGPDGDQGFRTISQALSKVGVLGVARKPIRNKANRAAPAAGAMKSGFVFIVESGPRNDWNHNFEFELSKFPNAATDDQVDALSHGWETFQAWDRGEL